MACCSWGVAFTSDTSELMNCGALFPSRSSNRRRMASPSRMLLTIWFTLLAAVAVLFCVAF